MALYSIDFGIAIILAPSIGLGIAGKYSFNSMFYFFIILSILTAIGFAVLKRKNKNSTALEQEIDNLV